MQELLKKLTAMFTQSPPGAFPGSILPSFTGVLEVRHCITGRIRVYIPKLTGRNDFKALLEGEMMKIKGIESVSVNPLIGTILIIYNPNALSPIILISVLIKLLNLEKDVEHVPESLIVKELKNVEKAFDRAIYEKTKGLVNFKTVVLVALVGLGIFRFGKKPGIFPPVLTLIWWVYSSIFSTKFEERL